MICEYPDKIFGVDESAFEPMALEIFRYQYENSTIYRLYVDTLGIDHKLVKYLHQVPFLPIRFFKSHHVVSGNFQAETVFESSGTTQTIASRHYIKDLNIYRKSFTGGFEQFYGSINNWCVIGLLPSYLERNHSSLVVMVNEMIKKSNHPKSGFYLYEFDKLAKVLQELEQQKQPVLLVGVTFALLDFAAAHPMPLKETVIMETGGMKGRKRELTRAEVHEALREAFGIEKIHAEYGMTEMLSQAYSKGNGIFHCQPWMRIAVREEDDPLKVIMPWMINETKGNVTGVINVIDLANIHSCSFIATDDMGRLYNNGAFEVLGRVDNSDMRGCSLMMLESV
jgi:hypothetical protein